MTLKVNPFQQIVPNQEMLQQHVCKTTSRKRCTVGDVSFLRQIVAIATWEDGCIAL